MPVVAEKKEGKMFSVAEMVVLLSILFGLTGTVLLVFLLMDALGEASMLRSLLEDEAVGADD